MNTGTFRLGRVAGMAGALAALLAIAPGTGSAQTEAGWGAYLGCWAPQSSDQAFAGPTAAERTLCILPGANAVTVELATVVDGSIVERETIDASGARRDFERDGCVGWESARVSVDGTRIYQSSEYECPGPFRRTTSGILGILPDGEWVNVQGVSSGEYTSVQVMRHRRIGDAAAVNADVALALQDRTMQIAAARFAASEPLNLADVVDASREVDGAVVEAWLIEHGQNFRANARDLVALEEAGVSAGVIDLVVALSNPRVFAIDLSSRRAEYSPPPPSAVAVPVGVRGIHDPWYDPRYDRYGRYDPWGDRYGYGYGYGSGYYYSRNRPPVIIIREPPGDGGDGVESQPARAVNGRGYTRGGAPGSPAGESSGGTARRASEPSSSGSSSTGASSSGSSSTRSGSSDSSGGAEAPAGRTAKPRGS